MTFPPRLHLAHLPTPIQKLERVSVEVGKTIYIWRDDLTGFTESGNKIRKLEFLLADALEKGATRILTSGGYQSNHTRATTFAARRLGLEISLVLREPKTGRMPDELPTANLLLSQIAGADIHFISFNDYQAAGSTYLPVLESLAAAARQRGEKPYIILEGGSVPIHPDSVTDRPVIRSQKTGAAARRYNHKQHREQNEESSTTTKRRARIRQAWPKFGGQHRI